MSQIVAGDDLTIPQTLKKNNVVFDMSLATEVKSRLLEASDKKPLTAEVTQANSGGADWANSLVEHVFASATTSGVTYEGAVLLETQVILSGKKQTWFSSGLEMVQGTID